MSLTTTLKTQLKITDARVVYPDGTGTVTALNGVSMTAQAGEMTAIIGESGSGKSTLLSVAAALVSPDSGTVTVAGEGVGGRDETERARIRREHIGFIFQQPNLVASLNARDQLLLTDHIRGVRGKALRSRSQHADDLLACVGLGGFGNRRMHQLSGGQRQRVNIARALMGEPELLLADEPTSALDHQLSREIVELLRSLTLDLGFATVMVTHDRGLLPAMDHVVEIRDGRVLD
ncbi:Macrolide export ATP-binding/permease protein MacB [Corynebacterium occultum]|uniref:Macrolide export ATP-binding/permease protein MacB n=1 Tax=Corynebacterium occultum TaxID=2675219 RepID=A0A6B8W0J3_9CORY|nr:ABC transporter ATP-binding protein [Corynebacterium occultum]QGU06001.1 Macrolide export ATP-binding/permease protein MacB [Corynebacterium occultum]